MTLLACSLVLLGVALLASASLRSQQDRISLTYSSIDHRLAKQAADAALHDAATTLLMALEDMTIEQVQGSHLIGEITGEIFPRGGLMQSCEAPDYFLEVLTPSGNVGASAPEQSLSDIYRVTARGKGLSAATTVVLQADFALQQCPVVERDPTNDVAKNGQDPVKKNDKNPEQSREKNKDQYAGKKQAQCFAPDSASDVTPDARQDSAQDSAEDSSQQNPQHNARNNTGCVPRVRRLAWRMLQAS